MKENDIQAKLIIEIKERFPGAIVLKNNPNYIQGIPDLLILYKDRWAMLEVKRTEDSPTQPNQEYYVNLFSNMSYSRFIHPNNKKEVLYELQQLFTFGRSTCIPESK